MSPLRKSMSPDTLNMLLILKANKQLWPDARIILKSNAKSTDALVAGNPMLRAAQATVSVEDDDKIGENGFDDDMSPDLDGFTYKQSVL